MKRSHVANKSTDPYEIAKMTAIHEAGHAAAIHFGNQKKALPPVCFQMQINRPNPRYPGAWSARIVGGRLIDNLPSSIAEATRGFSSAQKQAYCTAFEADMMNFLVGPLSEANYVALRDDEIFNTRLVDMERLSRYGGEADLSSFNDYLVCFEFIDEQERIEKTAQIFADAFNFINDREHWRAIMGLSHYILANNHPILDCVELINVLETPQNRSNYSR